VFKNFWEALETILILAGIIYWLIDWFIGIKEIKIKGKGK